jgi:prepilin-type N-terminal cleavage/methylation domain-containing protein
MRGRRGFTLLEMSITLAVMAVAAMLVVPALVDFGQVPQRRTAEGLLSLLKASRALAIDSNTTVTVVIDPTNGKYRVDSTGVFGTGAVTEGQIDETSMETMATTAVRVKYSFGPTGAAVGDTVRVRGIDSSVVVLVDPWNGVARAVSQ